MAATNAAIRCDGPYGGGLTAKPPERRELPCSGAPERQAWYFEQVFVARTWTGILEIRRPDSGRGGPAIDPTLLGARGGTEIRCNGSGRPFVSHGVHVARSPDPTDAGDPPGGRAVERVERSGGRRRSPVTVTGAADAELLYAERYAPSVRLAHLLIGDRGRAEELVQDAFVRVLPRLAELDDPAAYLRTVVVNLCRDAGRRTSRARVLRHDRPLSVPGPEVPATSTAVWLALQRLPDRQRAALCLRFYDDLSTDAIAELLGVRPATVRSLVHRGLATLKEAISDA